MGITIVKPPLPSEFLVDNRAYTDPKLFDDERQRLFLRVWNFVCHASEVSAPGDFITTTVAGQPLVICRTKAGEVRAYFNTCRHRAAQVVREPSGNAAAFTCFYHLWTYDLDGTLTGVPEANTYTTSYCPGGLDKAATSLVPVRAEVMHGLVFVCFDDAAPSLADFLGADFAAELASPLGAPDVRVARDWSKQLHANWKMEPENSRDGYHATLLHKRLRGLSPPKPFKVFPNGHAVQRLGLDYDAARKAGTLDGILAEQPDLADRFMTNPLPGVTLDDPSRIITIFPDVLIAIRYSTVLIVKQIPISAEETWFETRYVYLAGDTDEQIDLRRKHWNMYWAEDGGNLPEDWEAWEAQQIGAHSIGVRYSLISRGEVATEGMRGDDNRVRSFWSQWRAYMGTTENAPLTPCHPELVEGPP
jgi:phenylpropionate dioxygenase-like ring-hydroxylating dioxygenase large terminal subunit